MRTSRLLSILVLCLLINSCDTKQVDMERQEMISDFREAADCLDSGRPVVKCRPKQRRPVSLSKETRSKTCFLGVRAINPVRYPDKFFYFSAVLSCIQQICRREKKHCEDDPVPSRKESRTVKATAAFESRPSAV